MKIQQIALAVGVALGAPSAAYALPYDPQVVTMEGVPIRGICATDRTSCDALLKLLRTCGGPTLPCPPEWADLRPIVPLLRCEPARPTCFRPGESCIRGFNCR